MLAWRRQNVVVDRGRDSRRRLPPPQSGNSVGREPVEEFLKGLIVRLQLLGVADLARTVGGVDAARNAVGIMCVRE